MDSKQEKIQKLIALQRKFIQYEQTNGLDPQAYFAPENGHVLEGYQDEFDALATEIRQTAHEELGTEK